MGLFECRGIESVVCFLFLLCSALNCSAVAVENLESLGDSITTAVLLSWSKEPGDSVKEDDVIAVLETDKVGIVLLLLSLPPPPR